MKRTIQDPRTARIPAHMHAAFIDAPGGPAQIRYGVLPVPVPGPGQLLLRTEALAVNHVDLLVRSGVVGSAALQIAVEAGCRVIAVAGAPDAHWVAGLGAAAVLDYRDPQMVRKPGHAAKEGASVIWDCSGSLRIDEQARLLGIGGRIIHTASIDARQHIDTGALDRRDISVHGFAISNASVPGLALAAAHLNTLFAGPGIRTRIGAALQLRATAEAHRMLEAGRGQRIGGKIVVVPDPR